MGTSSSCNDGMSNKTVPCSAHRYRLRIDTNLEFIAWMILKLQLLMVGVVL